MKIYKPTNHTINPTLAAMHLQQKTFDQVNDMIQRCRVVPKGVPSQNSLNNAANQISPNKITAVEEGSTQKGQPNEHNGLIKSNYYLQPDSALAHAERTQILAYNSSTKSQAFNNKSPTNFGALISQQPLLQTQKRVSRTQSRRGSDHRGANSEFKRNQNAAVIIQQLQELTSKDLQSRHILGMTGSPSKDYKSLHHKNVKRAIIKQLPKDQQLSTYSNSQLVIASVVNSQIHEQQHAVYYWKQKVKKVQGKKGGEEDKLGSIFEQIRMSKEYSGVSNLSQFAEQDNRNIHDNATLWKMMRKMAGAGALIPPSQSDNNRVDTSIMDQLISSNNSAPNYLRTISRTHGGNILPAMSVANSDAIKYSTKVMFGQHSSQRELMFSQMNDRPKDNTLLISPEQTRNPRLNKGFSVSNGIKQSNNSYQGDHNQMQRTTSLWTGIEQAKSPQDIISARQNSSNDELDVSIEYPVGKQSLFDMTAKNSSHALKMISDKDRQSVSALAATITKNKTFIKQQIMHSTTVKKEPPPSQLQKVAQPAVVSLHTTAGKQKNGSPNLVLIGGNQSPNPLKQQTFFSYQQDSNNNNNVLPSIEDQQYNPLVQNQQQVKGNSILSPNKMKNRTDALKKNIIDQQLVLLYDNFHNPMNIVGGPNNRTLIECYLQKQKIPINQPPGAVGNVQQTNQGKGSTGDSNIGEGMTIKGLGVSSVFLNGFPETRDSIMGTSIYNFTNPRRKKRKLFSARHHQAVIAANQTYNNQQHQNTFKASAASIEQTQGRIKVVEKTLQSLMSSTQQQQQEAEAQKQQIQILALQVPSTSTQGLEKQITQLVPINHPLRPQSKGAAHKPYLKVPVLTAQGQKPKAKPSHLTGSSHNTLSQDPASAPKQQQASQQNKRNTNSQNNYKQIKQTPVQSQASTKQATTSDETYHNSLDEDDDEAEENEEEDDTERSDDKQKSYGYHSHKNFSFRPRKPIINPVDIQRQEYEKQMQMRNEAREKSQQYSLKNKEKNTLNTFIICPGNNSQIIKQCMELRSDRWEETHDFDTLYNFKWHPISRGIKFDQVNTHGTRQLVNHFENHQLFTNKDNMFRNLFQLCESKKISVFDYVPLTFMLEVDSVNSAYDLERFVTYFTYVDKLMQGKPLEMLKYDPDMMESTLQNINQKFMNTYQMSKDERGPLFAKMKVPSSHFLGHNIWILKATGFNRGRGIHVFNKLEELQRLIKEYTDGTAAEAGGNQQQAAKIISKNIKDANNIQINPNQSALQIQASNTEPVPSFLKSTSFVIQKYVERPLLLIGRKFDIRAWVLVAHDQRCFLFKEGYIRTSCEEFSLSQESIAKAHVHLTNNAVQKFASNYGKFEDGNQLSYGDMERILESQAKKDDPTPMPQNYVNSYLVPKFKEQIIMSLESVKRKLKVGKGFFELFGYDFILDGEYNPWLIEVNTNPCLEESSKLLEKYVPRMVNDMLKLTVDLAFPPKRGQAPYNIRELNKFTVPGYSNDENMWEKICTLAS